MSWWKSLLPRQRWLIICVAITAVLVGGGWLVARRHLATYTQTGRAAKAAGLPAVAFNFRYPRSKFALRRAGAARDPGSQGAYVTIDKRNADGVLLRRFQVGPFQPGPQYATAPRTQLPFLVIPVMHQAARTYSGYAQTVEGSAAIAGKPGYQFYFSARERVGGQRPQELFGRIVILALPPLDQGVEITQLATPGPAMRRPTDIAADKTFKEILASFAFGT